MNNQHKKRGVHALLRDRKAQITVFMIVGIILLFSSALLFYIRGQIVTGISAEFIPTIEEVPLEAQPIKIFIEDCMRKIGTEGLIKMGAHGGYINPTDTAYGDVFTAGIEPTESDALMIIQGKSTLIPYWWHMSSPNSCTGGCQFESNRPALYKRQAGERSIEGQLDTYIRKNLPECFENFNIFKEQGFDIEILGDLEPDFKVAEKESLVILTYPMRVSKEGRAIDVEQFLTKIDVNLKQVYELASDIVNSEIAINFLELHTLNLIAMYSKPVSVDRLPPTGHFSFDRGEYLIWTTTETRNRLESYVLPPGISMLQIIGTANYQRHAIFDAEKGKYDRVSTGMMDKTLVTLNSSRVYPRLETRITYLDWWPTYLNINDAEILKPEEVGPAFTGPLMDLIGMKQYKFGYDLSFPVLVTVTDPFAFDGKGLKFSFALESNLRDNLIMNSSYRGLPKAPAVSYFCDVNQRNSGLITVEVEEMYTGDPVPHARVDFVAGDELCFVGFAELDENNRSVLSTNFPVGAGEIRIIKDDYVPLKRQFSALLDVDANHTFKMMPLYSVNATVVPVPLVYQQQRYVLPPGIPTASLTPREIAIMSFTRMDDDEFGEYDSFLAYNVSEGPVEFLIVPGTYEVSGSLMLNDKVVIPRERKVINMPLFMDDKEIIINQSVFDTWSSGGVEFNNVTGYLEITPSDLFGSRMVRFKMLRFPLPTTHSKEIGSGSDLEQLGEHELYSSIYKHELQPEWIK